MATATKSMVAQCVTHVLSSEPNDEAVLLLQVGAHLAWFDGNDLLATVLGNPTARSLSWRALLVEPQPHIYAQLARLVEPYQPKIRAAHSAVCARDQGNVTFYSIDPRIDMRTGVLYSVDEQCNSSGSGFGSWRAREIGRAARGGSRRGGGGGASAPGGQWSSSRPHCGRAVGKVPPWASQVASLDREAVLRNLPNELGRRADKAKYIIPTTVRCDTAQTLLARHGLAARDVRVLSIDAEGYDASILASMQLGSGAWRSLRLVLFEHKHAQTEVLCSAVRALDAAGFTCECDEANVRCVSRNASCKHVPRRAEDPWASCVVGRLASLKGTCIHRPWWWWSNWRVRQAQ